MITSLTYWTLKILRLLVTSAIYWLIYGRCLPYEFQNFQNFNKSPLKLHILSKQSMRRSHLTEFQFDVPVWPTCKTETIIHKYKFKTHLGGSATLIESWAGYFENLFWALGNKFAPTSILKWVTKLKVCTLEVFNLNFWKLQKFCDGLQILLTSSTS